MMKSSSYIKGIMWGLAMLAWSACSNEEQFLTENNGEQTVTFRPVIKQDMHSRTIGDATGIDRLKVAVYEGTGTLNKKFILTEDWATAQANGIALTLIEGHTYNILFWAEDGDNSAYTLTDDGKISVDFTDYTNGGFDRMEEMDAFYGTATVTIGSSKNEDQGVITLLRPLAQLNFTDKTTQPTTGTHQTVVTFHSIPTAFNPFTGTVEMKEDVNQTFTFKDYPSETLSLNGVTYYYVSSNYLFAPVNGEATIKATLDLQLLDGTSINRFVFDGSNGNKAPIALKKNMKTNVYGNIVEQPQTWSIWDGKIPTESTLTTDNQNRYIIDEAADIAWLSVETNSSTLENNKTFVLTTDIDMAGKDNLSSIQLPSGSTVDGDGHTIKGMKLDNAVFGDASSVSIQNLTVEETQINNTNTTETTHVGVLLNTLDGSATITNVTIKNSTASTSKGAAGGMVGYIVRENEKDRSEILTVSFNGCKLNDVSVSGSASEGKFVGLLSGYDNNESLIFDAACEATNVSVADYTSVYIKANQSAWVTDDVTDQYDGWLGHETYRRGKVTFGGVRLVPRWDGTTIISKENLLLYNNTANQYEVYSPFDLAGVRSANASPSALYLMENVDMYGQGADGKFFVHSKFTKSAADPTYSTTDDNNHFKSFDYVDYLEGNNNSIYNLSIYSTFNGATTYYGAFILYCRNTTVHQNINLRNCCTVVPPVVKDNEDKSYGAAFVCNNDCSTYTMENVHAYDCKVFAVQKTGTLVGRLGVNTSGTINNCTVNDCYIENYECKDHQESFAGVVKFYSYGEVGGMFGFVEDKATITNCHVRGTTIYAFGQSDKNYIFVKIPGRHVGSFIGDIRTSDKDGDTILMENCTVDSNTKCTAGRWDKYSKCNIIGQAYYVSLAGDSKGTVKFNGSSIL